MNLHSKRKKKSRNCREVYFMKTCSFVPAMVCTFGVLTWRHILSVAPKLVSKLTLNNWAFRVNFLFIHQQKYDGQIMTQLLLCNTIRCQQLHKCNQVIIWSRVSASVEEEKPQLGFHIQERICSTGNLGYSFICKLKFELEVIKSNGTILQKD